MIEKYYLSEVDGIINHKVELQLNPNSRILGVKILRGRICLFINTPMKDQKLVKHVFRILKTGDEVDRFSEYLNTVIFPEREYHVFVDYSL